MAAHELLGPDNQQAAVGKEKPSVHTSPEQGPLSVDNTFSDHSSEPIQAQESTRNSFTRRLLRISTPILLAAAMLSPELANHAISTFIKPTPAEASATPNGPDSKENRDSLETASDPFTPYEFTSNAGERVKITFVFGTGPIFPNTEISFNDTAKIEIVDNPAENLQAPDGLYLNLNPNINQVTPACVQYDREEDNLYFVESYRVKNQEDQTTLPTKVRIVPWKTRKDYKTHAFLPASLPNETIDNYIKSCKNSDDNSSLDIRTSKSLLYRVFKKTGEVKILQIIFNVFLPAVLNGAK